MENIPFYDETKIKKDHEQVSAYPKEEAAITDLLLEI